MDKEQTAIIKLLLYYDIFDHPLTLEEIGKNCNLGKESSGNLGILKDMTEKGFIYQLNGYYSVRNDTSLIEKRINGSRLATDLLPKAFRIARFISSFPFVRSVSLSGSISKDYMDNKKDVDYFIIVRSERLWLIRTILILYKRIILFNSYKYFCLNYFVDDEHLEIENKNLFTATELFTLLPVTGKRYFNQLVEANKWVRSYFSLFPIRDIGSAENEPQNLLKRTLEWMLNNRLGNKLDLFAMKWTVRFWKRKYKNDLNDLFNKSFRFERYVAKYHPENFQDLILDQYGKKIKEYEKENLIHLN